MATQRRRVVKWRRIIPNCSFCCAYLVDGLGDGRLHEINITHNLRRKGVPQVLMELPIFQVV